MSIVIIDYGIGNLASVLRSAEVCGANAIVSDNPADLKTASGIILPGVGAFADGMKNLQDRGWVEVIKEEVLANKIPLLGICLGMHLLADVGEEGAETQGLGLISGRVKKFVPTNNEKIPHVGWNEVSQKTKHQIFLSIENNKDFYFVHSYHYVVAAPENVIGTTPYCGEFASVISKGNIIGAQFHPEKSQVVGLQFLKNFIQSC